MSGVGRRRRKREDLLEMNSAAGGIYTTRALQMIERGQEVYRHPGVGKLALSRVDHPVARQADARPARIRMAAAELRSHLPDL